MVLFTVRYNYVISLVVFLDYYNIEGSTWDLANSFCNSQNQKLLELRTQEDFQMAKKVRSEIRSFFVGGTDRNSEGVWKWESDGNGDIPNEFWQDGQVRATEDKDCMVFARRGLIDYSCTKVETFACEDP